MKAKDINFAAMLQIAVRILTAPAESFREMPKKGGFLEPLVFALVMGLTASIILAIWSLLGFGYGGGATPGVAAIFLSIIYMPVIFAICSFIGAAIVFLIWKLIGSTKNYEVFCRCIFYLYVSSFIWYRYYFWLNCCYSQFGIHGIKQTCGA